MVKWCLSETSPLVGLLEKAVTPLTLSATRPPRKGLRKNRPRVQFYGTIFRQSLLGNVSVGLAPRAGSSGCEMSTRKAKGPHTRWEGSDGNQNIHFRQQPPNGIYRFSPTLNPQLQYESSKSENERWIPQLEQMGITVLNFKGRQFNFHMMPLLSFHHLIPLPARTSTKELSTSWFERFCGVRT